MWSAVIFIKSPAAYKFTLQPKNYAVPDKIIIPPKLGCPFFPSNDASKENIPTISK